MPLLVQAVVWAENQGPPDGWFHEELAEEDAAVGWAADAREQARLALPLVLDADSALVEDAERLARLRELADQP